MNSAQIPAKAPSGKVQGREREVIEEAKCEGLTSD